MRQQDIRVFIEVARDHNVWILVRETNAASLQYIGRPGFRPKPIDCKAKTADHGLLEGLVVSPELRPESFSSMRRASALKCWRAFLPILESRSEWDLKVAPGNRFHGAVTFHGAYVHGDYDLKDVIDQDHFSRNIAVHDVLRGQKHTWSPEYRRVRDDLNRRLGVPMIQHGAEAQYADHPELDETVRVFSPFGTTATFHSSSELRSWYQMNARQTLTGEPSPRRGDPNWKPRVLRGGRS